MSRREELEQALKVKGLTDTFMLTQLVEMVEILEDMQAAQSARGIPFPPDMIIQTKTVKAGDHGVVYNYDIPRGFIGFITSYACYWYANTYVDFEIDGRRKEKVERIIGALDSTSPLSCPVQLKKPYIAYKNIRWTAYNNSDADKDFEVLCDGELYDLKTAKLLSGVEF